MQSATQSVAPKPGAEYVLSISGMSKVFTGGGTTFRLDVPEFKLRRGGIFGLVGRSGSGKSTMLDLLAMVSKPTIIGNYDLHVPDDNDDLNSIDVAQYLGSDNQENGSSKSSSRKDDDMISFLRRNYFGYVTQSGGLFPFLTLRQNLELPFRISGRPLDWSKMEAQIARFDLLDQLDKKPSGLSGGQRQRASILRALSTNPALLLADEPTAAIDENLAEVIIAEMRQMAKEQNTTVLIVSHDMQLINSHVEQTIHLTPERQGPNMTRSVCQLS